MMEPQPQLYQWGQPVRARLDLFNDGSHPECEEDALLVRMNDHGEIIQAGMHVESNTAVYLVEFDGKRIVGCLENEIEPLLAEKADEHQVGCAR
jgi:nitrogen fixation protein NifZ